MKKIYQCEICRRQSENKKEIQKCEKRGVPNKFELITGMIYGNATLDSFYNNITFSMKEYQIKNHSIIATSWACRDNGYGDSLYDSGCNTEFGHFNIPKNDLKYIPDKNHPTFKRMVEFLLEWFSGDRSKITCWDGKKPILLDDFLLLK